MRSLAKRAAHRPSRSRTPPALGVRTNGAARGRPRRLEWRRKARRPSP